MDITTHSRGYILERDHEKRGGGPRYRAQVADLVAGDTLAEFGRVLEYAEVQPQDGSRMFRLRTEHPQQWPVKTDVFTVPGYLYYGVVALAD